MSIIPQFTDWMIPATIALWLLITVARRLVRR